jgi:hypothetical protein
LSIMMTLGVLLDRRPAELAIALGEKRGENIKFRYWMVAKAVIVAVFGIGFVLFPVWLGSLYGMDLSPS